MDPGGQKSIFGQKTKSSIFRPKLAPKCSLEVSNRFLVKKWKIQIFDKKWTLWVKNRFLVKKSKVQFFDQNYPKNGSYRSQIDFWSKNEKFKFLTKNWPWRSKIDFWSKGRKCYFSTKIGQKWSLEVSNRFLVEKGQNQFFDQKLTLEVKNRFLAKKSKVQICRPK